MKPDHTFENFHTMVLLPFYILILALFLEYSGFDVWWGTHFYDFQNQTWPFKHHWLFDGVIHTGGQWLDKVMGVVWLVFFAMTFFRKSLKKFQKILLYFISATVLGPIIVGVCKEMTHIYAPWDLQTFHGMQPYIRFFDTVPEGAPVGHAFPAGHASGGYAFMSLYFVLVHFRFPKRYIGLLPGVFLGLVFGIGQQVRGAHFPSHDLFTLVICWYAALGTYVLFYPKELCVLGIKK